MMKREKITPLPSSHRREQQQVQLPPHLMIALITQYHLWPSVIHSAKLFHAAANKSHISSLFLCWILSHQRQQNRKAYWKGSFICLTAWMTYLLTNYSAYLITHEHVVCSIIKCFCWQDKLVFDKTNFFLHYRWPFVPQFAHCVPFSTAETNIICCLCRSRWWVLMCLTDVCVAYNLAEMNGAQQLGLAMI